MGALLLTLSGKGMLNESGSPSCGVWGFVAGPAEWGGPIGPPPPGFPMLFIGVRLFGELFGSPSKPGSGPDPFSPFITGIFEPGLVGPDIGILVGAPSGPDTMGNCGV